MKTDRREGGEAFNLPSLGAMESSGSDSLSQLRETQCASQLLGSEARGLEGDRRPAGRSIVEKRRPLGLVSRRGGGGISGFKCQ